MPDPAPHTPASEQPSPTRTVGRTLQSLPPVALIGLYIALHLALSGRSALVYSPGGVDAAVVLPAFAALLVVMLLRRDDPQTAGVLVGVAVAAASLGSLIVQLVIGPPRDLTLQGLLMGWVRIPVVLGIAAGVNAGLVVWLVRRIQRALASPLRDASPAPGDAHD